LQQGSINVQPFRAADLVGLASGGGAGALTTGPGETGVELVAGAPVVTVFGSSPPTILAGRRINAEASKITTSKPTDPAGTNHSQ
jgi:hypothetical protein